jgi:hypothetical protein
VPAAGAEGDVLTMTVLFTDIVASTEHFWAAVVLPLLGARSLVFVICHLLCT